MKHDKSKVLVPAIATMVILHLSSVALGKICPYLFDQVYIEYAAVVLFLAFGILMLWDAYHLEEKCTEEKIKELEEELENEEKGKLAGAEAKEKSTEMKEGLIPEKGEHGLSEGRSPDTAPQKDPLTTNLKMESALVAPEGQGCCSCFKTNPYLNLIILLFVGECGDRTQIVAIAYTGTHNAIGVAVGGSIVFKSC